MLILLVVIGTIIFFFFLNKGTLKLEVEGIEHVLPALNNGILET
jgi:hypothetical protein